MAARVIESGMADMVAVGRPLLADPDWGTKIAAGKACDIRRCISCNKGCTDAIQNRQFLSCVLNAENGYENTRSIQPAAQKKKIAVLGGGPAGLEAARVAALRGHDVTLFEKTTTLGGQLNIACVPPRKEEMRRAAQDLIHAVCNAGVHLCMGQTRTAEQLKDSYFCANYAKGASADFESAYKAEYGEDYPNGFAPLGYDAATTVLYGIQAAEDAGLEAGTDEYKQAVIDGIKNGTIEGITGTFTFDEHHNPVKQTAILCFDGATPVLKEMF